MSAREFAVLQALNIASTRYGRVKQHNGWREMVYQASAAQIAGVLRTDARIASEFAFFPMDTRQVGLLLRALAKGRHPAPLVERVGSRKWCLTDAALSVLIA